MKRDLQQELEGVMGVRGYHYKEHVHMLKGANNTKWMMDGPRSLSRQKTDSRAGGQVDESDFPRETDSLFTENRKDRKGGSWWTYIFWVVLGCGGELFLVFSERMRRQGHPLRAREDRVEEGSWRKRRTLGIATERKGSSSWLAMWGHDSRWPWESGWDPRACSTCWMISPSRAEELGDRLVDPTPCVHDSLY